MKLKTINEYFDILNENNNQSSTSNFNDVFSLLTQYGFTNNTLMNAGLFNLRKDMDLSSLDFNRIDNGGGLITLFAKPSTFKHNSMYIFRSLFVDMTINDEIAKIRLTNNIGILISKY